VLPAEEEIVLGEDRAGAHVSMRDKLRPMLAILILMLGSIAVAGLVAVELERRTAEALLVTPATVADLLGAKSITGTLLGASQALLFLLLTWSFGAHGWLVVVLMLLGAAMMSAIGLIAGAGGQDFMTTMFLAIAMIIPMFVPTFAALFPGSTSLWVQLMPSHGFVEAMVGLLGYGRSPAEVATPIALTLGWCVLLVGAALLLLRRRVQAL
jgi:ABC-2 type transport system permease protein